MVTPSPQKLWRQQKVVLFWLPLKTLLEREREREREREERERERV